MGKKKGLPVIRGGVGRGKTQGLKGLGRFKAWELPDSEYPRERNSSYITVWVYSEEGSDRKGGVPGPGGKLGGTHCALSKSVLVSERCRCRKKRADRSAAQRAVGTFFSNRGEVMKEFNSLLGGTVVYILIVRGKAWGGNPVVTLPGGE